MGSLDHPESQRVILRHDKAGERADIFAVCPYANPMPAKTREFIRVTREVLASQAGFIV